MVPEDFAYYRKRAAEEVAAAESADSAQAADAHRQLAHFYSEMIERLAPEPEPPIRQPA
jgi:hypothetical protein